MRITKADKQIGMMYQGMGLDEEMIVHKSKLLLSIYRDVVWSTMSKASHLRADCVGFGTHNLNVALAYLSDFAPTEEKNIFEEKVRNIFESRWIVELIDTTMIKLYEYHQDGKLYYNILKSTYLSAFPVQEVELIELLSIDRSTYYRKKREAIKLFGVAMWGYSLPEYRNVFCDVPKIVDASMNQSMNYFFE